jgi:Protein of unknown function (DUF2829).
MGDGIGWAVKQLIQGQRVRRSGWNGKSMYLLYVPGTPNLKVAKGTLYAKALGDDAVVDIDPHIDMRTAKGTMQPGWVASQADLLATDWEVAL